MANWMDQQLVNCAPNREETEYMGYIPATIGGKQNPVMRLLAVLEIFGLASYEVRGGQNLEIFVRVNDPQKILMRSPSRLVGSTCTSITNSSSNALAKSLFRTSFPSCFCTSR